MAKAFPKSEFYGFDLHPASIEIANSRAKEQEVTNIHFSVAPAKDFPGRDYEFATVFDALHDMGDPVGAASHVRQSLRPDGTFMIVEPIAALCSLKYQPGWPGVLRILYDGMHSGFA